MLRRTTPVDHRAPRAHPLTTTLLLLAALTAATESAQARAPTGGSATCAFSLARGSISLAGRSAADLLVDDPGVGAPGTLTLALPAAALGLTPAANIDAISGGRDNGVAAMLASLGSVPNVMHQPQVVYQFSVNRTTSAGAPGSIAPIPFTPPAQWPVIQQNSDFAPQFSGGGQAADVFGNTDAFGPPPSARASGFKLGGADLELQSAGGLDDLDAFSSVGALGAMPDANGDGRLDAGIRIYFSVDGSTPGFDPGAIYVMVGAEDSAPRVFAWATQLGLSPGDDIDALSVWDAPPYGTFGPGDGVSFSLRSGSPSVTPALIVPGDPNAVPIGPDGIFFVAPSAGPGIIAGLPGSYFGLGVGGSELDEIKVVDPRDPLPVCAGGGGSGVQRFDSIIITPSVPEIPPLPGGGWGERDITFALNTTDRSAPGIESINDFHIDFELVSLPLVSLSFVSITGPLSAPPAVLDGCGGSDPSCMGPFGPGTGGSAGAHGVAPPVAGNNLCVATARLKGLAPGVQTVRVNVVAVGPLGPIPTPPQEFLVRVLPPACPGDADGDGFVGLSDIALIIGHWGQSVPPGTNGDVDGDGVVGLGDIARVISNWGAPCV